jgi:hypothetical protein
VAPVGLTIPGGPDGASRVRSLKLDIYLLPVPDDLGAAPVLEYGDLSPFGEAMDAQPFVSVPTAIVVCLA